MKSNKLVEQAQHEVSFDYLRTIATLCVIAIHVCALQWDKIEIGSAQWNILHFIDMSVKFCVPVFFMISGRFYLDPERDVSARKIGVKIVHLMGAFLFWSLIYSMINVLRFLPDGNSSDETIKWIIIKFFAGEYHMWFLYSIAGLYLITPLLRKITENRALMEYFLLLFCIFALLIPVICLLPKIGVFFVEIKDKIDMHFVLGYSGYYVMGYYLYRYRPNITIRKVLYVFGALSIVITCTVTYAVSLAQGAANEDFANYLTPNVACSAAAVFVFVLENSHKWSFQRAVSYVSSASFGVYLAHPLVLKLFERIGFVPTVFPVLISIPVLILCVLILSCVIVEVIRRIPFLGHFAV